MDQAGKSGLSVVCSKGSVGGTTDYRNEWESPTPKLFNPCLSKAW